MGTQLNTQPQIFKNNVVVGLPAVAPSVYGLTVYGDISASGTIYGVGGSTGGSGSGALVPNLLLGNGTDTYTLTNYADETESNYLVFIGGIAQRPGTDYTISSNNIIFNGVVAVGVEILVYAIMGELGGLNFIEKPASTNGGYVLTYNSTTSTWVASAVPKELPTSATTQQVLTYDGSTSTWVASAAPNSSLSIAGTVVILQDQKPPNTGGGTSLANTWQKRVLNTKVTDVGNLCILSNSQFTLVAGTYLINASAPCFKGNSHQIRLYNVTDSIVDCLGTTEYSWNGSTNAIQTRSHINDLFTITATKTFELQHYIQTNSSDGLGYGFGLGTEIFSTVQLIKLG